MNKSKLIKALREELQVTKDIESYTELLKKTENTLVRNSIEFNIACEDLKDALKKSLYEIYEWINKKLQI